MSVTMQATRPSPCFACDFGIRAGQMIQPVTCDEGGFGAPWEHVTCPPAPTVCAECFTEVARNGACLCGAV